MDPEDDLDAGRPLGGELCPLSGVEPLSTAGEKERQRAITGGNFLDGEGAFREKVEGMKEGRERAGTKRGCGLLLV